VQTVYEVAYDLNKQGQDYSGLIKELKDSPTWARPSKSTWLIKTHESAKEVHERLAPYLDASDRILVIEVTANYSGYLDTQVWEWVTENLG
jgi:hypothetical protein